ncbi:ATP-binding protein [Rhodoferax sp.]|uniref:ATP-binding protein n=1 Tax=Rhodoferax sp. TaxID=50421 RepID=UPI002ACE13D2|nr:ATP-binding protein [Rhodoferax sp.]MDZ7921955.1 ATP-binding protein [Rhodoferax sp.]
MNPLTDEQLTALLDDLESDRTERKAAWAGNAPEKARQAVCAFANDLPNHGKPGIVFIGANDDGSAANILVTDQLLQTLSDMKTDGKIVPPPTLTVEQRVLKGAAMAVVTVWPADAPPVRYEGRIWIRVGPRRGHASAQDERILNEKRRHRDRAFDTHPIQGCPISELNRVAFESEYLPQAVAADVLAVNGRSYEERLASMGMIASADDPTPTVIGILTLGKTPRTWVPCAYVQFLRIRGTQWGDPVVDEQEMDGSLDQMLRRLDDKLKATLAVAVDFTSGTTTEVRSTPYPLSALQQLTRNAVMHRTYENTNAPVRVYWFDDRIEITNAGGPYGTVTAENFGRPGVSDYRNPNVASVLKTLGFVQRFGFGIAEARRALKANGNPDLEFQVEPTIVLATVRRAP